MINARLDGSGDLKLIERQYMGIRCPCAGSAERCFLCVRFL